MTISKETAEFLTGVLNSTTLGVGDPNFEENTANIIKAKRELAAIILEPPTKKAPTKKAPTKKAPTKKAPTKKAPTKKAAADA